MLTIGTLRWKGRCSRHPQYDPVDGEAAIRGACQRCYSLLEIYAQHRKLVELMRSFGPVRERPVKRESEDNQPSLFD
jgi:hypothetical protein